MTKSEVLDFCHQAIHPGGGGRSSCCRRGICHIVVALSAIVPRATCVVVVVAVARPRHLCPGKAGAATIIIVVGRFDRSSLPSMTSMRS